MDISEQDKELLIKDLCARLPYGVIIHFNEGIGKDDQVLYGDRENGKHTQFNDGYFVDEFKPYLRPIESMTTEEHDELFKCYHNIELEEVKKSGDYLKAAYMGDHARYDWLNTHHFDFRWLIEKGLALEAPTGMYD